jgi:hypothetical protein
MKNRERIEALESRVTRLEERKGERRVAKLTAAIHRNVRMNDRRSTPGTRADRGES